MNAKKILEVDDEDAVLFAHEEVLTELGFEVDTAKTYEDAANIIIEKNFGIIVTDLNLANSPTFEGIKIIEAVKNTGSNGIIVVVSAYGDEEVKSQALEAGADYFLEKPVSSEQLKCFFMEKGII